MKQRKITFINIRKPLKRDINEELQWIGNSLGLFNLRDKDKSCYRIFIEILKSTHHKSGITSDELAFKLNLSRGTVVHHINKLMDSGIVTTEHSRYLLRVDNLSSLIDEIERDMRRMYDDLKDIARDIDKKLGI